MAESLFIKVDEVGELQSLSCTRVHYERRTALHVCDIYEYAW